jgi:hypothetical protein
LVTTFAIAPVAVFASAGCTSLLGDFTVGGDDGGADGTVDGSNGDDAQSPDALADVAVDSAIDSSSDGPACGSVGLLCCGGTACNAGLTCNTTGVCETCTCTGKQCGTDGCGHACGMCPAGQTCSPNGLCNCMGSCTGKTCGDDGCGNSCGTCATGTVCSGSSCAACGATGQLCCLGMTCTAPDTCDGTGHCVCNRATCTSLGVNCGSHSDGCGGTITCGTCSGGQTCGATGQCACPTGTTNCNGVCANLQTDNNNCGGCGLTCTNCSNGECLVALATNIPNAYGITINAIKAYVTSYQTSGGIYAVALNGSGPINITPNYPQNYPTGIVIDNSYVYWTNVVGGTVMRMPLGGQVAPTTLASGQSSPGAMAIDGSNLYWSNQYSPGTVMRAPLSNPTAATVLLSGVNKPAGIALDSTYAYVALTSDDYIVKVSLATGSIVSQVTTFENNPYAVAADTNNLYFTNRANGGDVRQVAKTASNAAGTVLGVTPSNAIPGGIATDGVNVYFCGNNTVFKCPVGVTTGCAAFVTNQQGAANVVVDSTSVYWTNQTAGTVMKMTPK